MRLPRIQVLERAPIDPLCPRDSESPPRVCSVLVRGISATARSLSDYRMRPEALWEIFDVLGASCRLGDALEARPSRVHCGSTAVGACEPAGDAACHLAGALWTW